jgi:hypothetical protein
VKLLTTPPCWCTHSVSKPDTRFINEYDASSPKALRKRREANHVRKEHGNLATLAICSVVRPRVLWSR